MLTIVLCVALSILQANLLRELTKESNDAPTKQSFFLSMLDFDEAELLKILLIFFYLLKTSNGIWQFLSLIG